MNIIRTSAAQIALLLSATTALLSLTAFNGDDVIVFSNTSGDAIGALVDARFDSQRGNDLIRIGYNNSVIIGRATGPDYQHTVFAFTRDRIPAIDTSARWTGQSDRRTIRFTGEYILPIKFWVVSGTSGVSFESIKRKIEVAYAYTDTVLRSERTGIQLGPMIVKNMMNTLIAARYSHFNDDSAIARCDRKDQLYRDIGSAPDTINVYIFGSVNGSNSGGEACGLGNNFIALGCQFSSTLLLHELGHCFGLGHCDNNNFIEHDCGNRLSDFSATNVMHPYSSVRKYFTEGQIIRIFYGDKTVLRSLHGNIRLNRLPAFDYHNLPLLKSRIWKEQQIIGSAHISQGELRYPHPYTATEQWLLSDCLEGSRETLIQEMRNENNVQSILQKALIAGPDRTTLREFDDNVQDALRQKESTGRSGDTTALNARTVESIVMEKEKEFIAEYRERAKSGLELIHRSRNR